MSKSLAKNGFALRTYGDWGKEDSKLHLLFQASEEHGICTLGTLMEQKTLLSIWTSQFCKSMSIIVYYLRHKYTIIMCKYVHNLFHENENPSDICYGISSKDLSSKRRIIVGLMCTILWIVSRFDWVILSNLVQKRNNSDQIKK